MTLFPKKSVPKPEGATSLFAAVRSSKATAPAPEVVAEDKGAFSLFKRPAKPVEAERVEPTVQPVAPASFDAVEPDVVDVESTVIAEDAPTAAAAPRAKAFSFGLKKPASPQADEAAIPVAVAKKGAFSWGRAKPAAGEPTTGTEKPPKPAKAVKEEKQPKAPKAPKAAKTLKPKAKLGKSAAEIYLYTELDASTTEFWKATATGIARATEPAKGVGLSFGPEDFRFATSKKVSYAAANNLALSETSEYCSVVNESGGEFGAIYATPRERTFKANWSIAPGSLPLSLLLANKLAGRDPNADLNHEAIVGFNLTGPDSADSVVLLFRLTTDNQLSDMQVTVNPSDLQFVLRQFASVKRIDTDNAQVILFSLEELLSVCGSITAFPSEAVWRGYPVRKLINGAFLVSALGAAALTALAGQAFVEHSTLQARKTRVTAEAKDADKRVSDKLAGAIWAFASQQSIDPNKAFQTAQAIWLPGATVSLTSDLSNNTTRYELRMPLQQGKPFNGRPSVAGALTPSMLSDLVDLAAPERCNRDGTYISGNINEVQVIVNCETPPSPVARYRLD